MAVVTGTFEFADGTPDQGSVLLHPAITAPDMTPSPRIITQGPVKGALDASGTVSLDVLASDDDGWALSDPMPYVVTTRLVSGHRDPYTVLLMGEGPHNLALLQPVEGVVPDVQGASGVQITHPHADDVLAQMWDTGSSRWQTVHYDSGMRELEALTINGWTANSITLMRSSGQVVMKLAGLDGSAATSDVFLIVPAGFRPVNTAAAGTVLPMGFESAGAAGQTVRGVSITAGNGNPANAIQFPRATAGAWLYGQLQWVVEPTLPSTLPGATVAPAPY